MTQQTDVILPKTWLYKAVHRCPSDSTLHQLSILRFQTAADGEMPAELFYQYGLYAAPSVLSICSLIEEEELSGFTASAVRAAGILSGSNLKRALIYIVLSVQAARKYNAAVIDEDFILQYVYPEAEYSSWYLPFAFRRLRKCGMFSKYFKKPSSEFKALENSQLTRKLAKAEESTDLFSGFDEGNLLL